MCDINVISFRFSLGKWHQHFLIRTSWFILFSIFFSNFFFYYCRWRNCIEVNSMTLEKNKVHESCNHCATIQTLQYNSGAAANEKTFYMNQTREYAKWNLYLQCVCVCFQHFFFALEYVFREINYCVCKYCICCVD